MLISKRVRITRVIEGTWKHFVINIIICIVTYFSYHFIIQHHIQIPLLLPSILGTALSFFIGFKNSQAYDRWWEARKIWGELVNDSRSWSRQILSYLNSEDDQLGDDLKQRAIYNHLGFLYALKKNLRASDDFDYRKFLEPEDLT